MGCGCSLGREWDRRDVGGWCGGRCRSDRSWMREELVLAMIGEQKGSDSKTYKLTIIGEIP
jgi:hypothetical protein